MTVLAPPDEPVFALPEANRVPVSDHLARMAPFEPNRMFYIRQSLEVFKRRYPGAPTFDASQGDGGASLPGTPRHLLERAAQMQIAHGTAYDLPNGTLEFRRAVIEKYWRLDPDLGYTTENVMATAGGRDALLKAYMAALYLGYGRQGDVVITSRVPWVCYTWGHTAWGRMWCGRRGEPSRAGPILRKA
ncbi:hypothetical protein SE15_12780 [Thermanaerothrix daxensis]|uniref:Aminotransferase class I/classII domain-containing protein n=1 Tax=Thermanaerothrix daxensis TaxID=869279 RepID=A0A0P6Y9W0_9CHLR|nr:hypothetical protein [Thermanaerothrix daxensis]KPL82004.1 hypothetical protein SE15_12780 [Thermanaerothrix daxensis]